MKLKASKLVTFSKKALAEGWGYVLGGQGELWSKPLAEKWAKSRNKPKTWIGTKWSYFVEACGRWFGRKITDCSGLIIAAFRELVNPKYSDQTADGLYSRCSARGSIKTLPEIPGLCLHKSGHIGIYIGGGYAIEARGYKYGVVKTKVAGRGWTGWGKLADVDYSEVASGGGAKDMPLLKKGSEGTTVEKLQELLNADLGIALKVDGVFGRRTKKAVRNYQKKYKLKVDGIVGTQTWGKLLA